MDAVLARLKAAAPQIAAVLEGQALDQGSRGLVDPELEQLRAERERVAADLPGRPWLAGALPELDRRLSDRQLLLQAQATSPDRQLVELRAHAYALAVALDPALQGVMAERIREEGGSVEEAAARAIEEHLPARLRLDQLRPEQLALVEAELVERGVMALLSWEAQDWLSEDFREVAMTWLDRFVRVVVVKEKQAEVELNI
jgi:hypothetical protein